MTDCHDCGAALNSGDSVCPKCGAPAPGSTASFGPVEAVDSSSAPEVGLAEGPVLVVRKGPQLGERFFLDRERLVVGRDPDSDIFLNDMTVSRSHAVLDVAEGHVTVRDSGSLNGTYVNGVVRDSATLNSGDVVQIGTFQMVFFDREGAGR